ncbi:MAG: signal peptidase II [Candidatus Poribacteria bacterium]|nr:signal peptidase II [Candidatus Poribacteria bacterium]
MQQSALKSLPLLFGVTLPVLLIDQLTKWLIQQHIPPHRQHVIIEGIFNLRHDTNDGAAFGLMPGQNLPLIIISIAAIGFILFYYRHFYESLWMKVALGFLLGGALGNFIDRMRLGEVTDFLQFRLPGFWWPTFNVADVAVCIGAGMLMLHMFRHRGDYDAAKQIEN